MEVVWLRTCVCVCAHMEFSSSSASSCRNVDVHVGPQMNIVCECVLAYAYIIMYVMRFSLSKEPGNLLCRQMGVEDLCRRYLGQLLSIHPPGQHSLVDQQYRQFIEALCQKEISSGLWSHLKTLLRYLGGGAF